MPRLGIAPSGGVKCGLVLASIARSFGEAQKAPKDRTCTVQCQVALSALAVLGSVPPQPEGPESSRIFAPQVGLNRELSRGRNRCAPNTSSSSRIGTLWQSRIGTGSKGDESFGVEDFSIQERYPPERPSLDVSAFRERASPKPFAASSGTLAGNYGIGAPGGSAWDRAVR
jgi:hypothetical protein